MIALPLRRTLAWLSFAWLLASPVALAQTTAFTYQGKLTDAGNLANGSYDFEFKLFDLLTGGTQLGTTQTVMTVAVANGVFSVTLDFSACAPCFNGQARFLEIAAKKTTDTTFTPLSPRQPMTSAPYAIKSQSAASADALSVACVNCVTSSQIASVSGSAVSGTIPVASVPAGSPSYIQNTTSQQASSNFNISGNGIVGGSLGIANTTPNTHLDVVDNTGGIGAAQIHFGNSPADNGGYLVSTAVSQAIMAGGAKFNGSAWVAKNTSASLVETNVGVIRFLADSGLTAGSTFAPTEQMRVNSNGTVGIGTNNPTFKLQILDQSNKGLRVQTNAVGGSVASFGGNGDFQVDAPSIPGGRFMVKESGNVGIGTSAPAERLQVVGNAIVTGNLTVNGLLNAALPRRKYYMTSATPQGNAVLTACVAGYHMASLAEIFNTSGLDYATDLVASGDAHSLPDSGSGPPFSSFGFIRVGVTGTNNAVAGNANCISSSRPWSTNSSAVNGTAVALKPTWGDAPTNISPWDAQVRPCSNNVAPIAHVWCAQDLPF